MKMNLQEISDTCKNWDKFCDMKGFNVYALNEGGGNIHVELTIQESHKLGIVSLPDWKVED